MTFGEYVPRIKVTVDATSSIVYPCLLQTYLALILLTSSTVISQNQPVQRVIESVLLLDRFLHFDKTAAAAAQSF